MEYHQPVMLKEVLNALQVRSGGKYIDCTLGDAGHALEILKLGGRVMGLDVDENALKRATERVKNESLLADFTPVKGNFRRLEELAEEHGFSDVDGILYDLGYSSYQLGVEELGISFLADQKLDMRLDKDLGVTAADLVNALPEKELARMFFEYSDERYAKRFARAIVEHRNLKKLQTTKELSDLLASAAPSDYEHGRIHPATRVFQTLRIVVNNEIDNLEESLPQAARLLRSPERSENHSLPGGRMAVISFHSLEDKTVKSFTQSVRPMLQQVTQKPVIPDEEEINQNIRSRSAKLRVLEKI